MIRPKRKLKRVYVAGPYRAETAFAVEQNIMRARQVAAMFWERGIAVFCPHANTANLDGIAPDQVFLDAGVDFLLDCDAVVVLPGHAESKGTKAEIDCARDNKIPVYYIKEIRKDQSVDGIADLIKGLEPK